MNNFAHALGFAALLAKNMNNNIFSWKPQGNRFLLVKFVDKIRFNYSNSFPEKKRPIRFQKKKSSFPEKPPIRFQKNVSRKTSHLFLEASRAYI